MNDLLARPEAAAGESAPRAEDARSGGAPIGALRPARVAAPAAPPQPVSHTADTAYDFFDEEITAPRSASEPPREDTTVLIAQPSEPSVPVNDGFGFDDPSPERESVLPPRAAPDRSPLAAEPGFGAEELEVGHRASTFSRMIAAHIHAAMRGDSQGMPSHPGLARSESSPVVSQIPRWISAIAPTVSTSGSGSTTARKGLSGPRCGGPPNRASSQKSPHMTRQSGRPSDRQTKGADDMVDETIFGPESSMVGSGEPCRAALSLRNVSMDVYPSRQSP